MTTTPYSGGIQENVLYRERVYIKVGTNVDGTSYRGVFTIKPKQQIESSLLLAGGNTTDSSYRIGSAILTLTPSYTPTELPNLFAVLLPLGASVDDSVSWTKPSEKYDSSWQNLGGDVDPSAQNMIIPGSWSTDTNQTTASFDLAPYFSIWNATKPESLSIAIVDDGAQRGVVKFFSNESADIVIGGSALTNCRFFTGKEAQTTAISGIRVAITPTGGTAAISFVDPSCEAESRWAIFNAAATIGTTCSINSPDYEQGLILGSVVCTVVDKQIGQRGPILVVSGLSLGNIQNYYTTAEFSTNKNINSDSGYIELSNPNEKTLDDLRLLKENDLLKVDYVATVSPNNVKTFTISRVSDEKITANRARIYLKEQVVQEDRNTLFTELKNPSAKPSLQLQLLI